MRIGMNMLLFTTDPTDEKWWPLYEWLRRIGFEGVELPVLKGDPQRYHQLGRFLDDVGLSRTAVSVCAPQDDLLSDDPATRERGTEANKLALERCQAAGASLLVGPVYAGLGVFSGSAPTETEWNRGVEGIRQTVEHAERCGVDVALEFLNRFETYILNCVADTVRFVEAVDHPRCLMMYDTFHAHIEERNPASALRLASPYLAHVHISESNRATPGAGQVAWTDTFHTLQELGYNGWLTIEAFGSAEPDLQAATKIWRRMFENEKQLATDGLTFIRQSWRAVSMAQTQAEQNRATI